MKSKFASDCVAVALTMVVKFHTLIFQVAILATIGVVGYNWYSTHVILTNEEAEKVAVVLIGQAAVIEKLKHINTCI